MKLLIKLGGALLDEPASRLRIATEIRDLAAQGHRVVVVHGGGKQMTRLLEAQGVTSQFVDGLRVSSPAVIDALLQAVAGQVNKRLVAAFRQSNVPAVGLSGVDGALVDAEQLRPELGAVGNPTAARPLVLDTLLDQGFLPVVACVASNASGEIFNVNADQMACICAAALPAEQLLFLTDVEGVLDAAKQRIPYLSVDDCRALIREGVAVGGMQAKLEAACRTVEAGVEAIRILPGFRQGALRDALAGLDIGTAIRTGPPPSVTE
ncbi:MAG: acetylglutamate kinase [Bryobacterales bacterium]|nr:acetylglutamate kinase [Bryobacterales bacterium]